MDNTMKNSQGNVFKVCQKTSNTQRPDINFHLAASNKRKEECAPLLLLLLLRPVFLLASILVFV